MSPDVWVSSPCPPLNTPWPQKVSIWLSPHQWLHIQPRCDNVAASTKISKDDPENQESHLKNSEVGEEHSKKPGAWWAMKEAVFVTPDF